MKLSFAPALAYLSVASAHTIFQVSTTAFPRDLSSPTNTTQRVSVNDKEYPQHAGIRGPNQPNPTYDVNSGDLTCGKIALTNNEVIPVAAGDRFGAWWGHAIGGEQFPGDPDNPIAASHHGPVTAWLAKVDDAATAQVGSGLKFFKIAEDGFDVSTNTWGVDNMVANAGWSYFDVPSCVAPGDYLLRVELLALHSASTSMGAQFHGSCVNVRISGDGSFSPGETQSIPG
ncbi:glycoside hydrolase family 61 protein, partial [Candidatus Bathyarchaeota archaeon]|nr:glycoside hydrolase family 61 protein [Candidatus Bathyarchaeota archaeon]